MSAPTVKEGRIRQSSPSPSEQFSNNVTAFIDHMTADPLAIIKGKTSAKTFVTGVMRPILQKSDGRLTPLEATCQVVENHVIQPAGYERARFQNRLTLPQNRKKNTQRFREWGRLENGAREIVNALRVTAASTAEDAHDRAFVGHSIPLREARASLRFDPTGADLVEKIMRQFADLEEEARETEGEAYAPDPYNIGVAKAGEAYQMIFTKVQQHLPALSV